MFFGEGYMCISFQLLLLLNVCFGRSKVDIPKYISCHITVYMNADISLIQADLTCFREHFHNERTDRVQYRLGSLSGVLSSERYTMLTYPLQTVVVHFGKAYGCHVHL